MKQYVVDAFAERVFTGNTAAVCVMDEWISDELMQNIAIENNFSETAFTVKGENGYHLRWFTPGGEVDLCGHATLATAFTVLNYYEKGADRVEFTAKSGRLIIEKKGDLYEMDLPAYPLTQVEVTDLMEEVIGVRPLEAWLGRDLVCQIEHEEDVKNCSPDQEKMMKLDGLLLHVTAKGSEHDCVSRSFAPKLRIPEDPVCGSGHCHIVPFWAKKLGKQDILAYQASKRSGILHCRDNGDRVKLAGKAVLYSVDELYL